MPLPAAGLALLREFEGCRLEAYQDQGGIWTIGYGHTGPEVCEGLIWTQDQADAQLAADASLRATAVARMVPLLPDNQFAALVCLAYNIGLAAFGASTACRLVNAGDLAGVPAAIEMWNEVDGEVSAGLVRRRAAEVELWNAP
jgi:lysozyme